MLYIYVGKSAAGKDYHYRKRLKEGNISPVISTTTRPMRPGEQDGVDYYFVDRKEFLRRQNANKFLEWRCYDTLVNNVPAVWYYASPKLEDIDTKDYIVILDPQGALDTINAYGPENCKVIFITADDETRTRRAKERGGFDETEWNRRLKDDAIKFAPEVMSQFRPLLGDNFEIIDNSEDF